MSRDRLLEARPIAESRPARPGVFGRMMRSARRLLQDGGLQGFREALGPFLFCRQRVSLLAIDLRAGYTAPPLDPRAEIRRATPSDLARFRQTPEGTRSECYRDQIDGAEPFVAWWEGQPAHIAWIYDHTIPNRFVRLVPQEAELKHAYTFEAFRGHGLYGITNAVMAEELARRGYQRVYGHVVDHGAAFRLGLEMALMRVGFRRVSTFFNVRVLGVQIRPRLSL